MKMKLILLLVSSLVFSACGTFQINQLRSDLIESKNTYKNCISSNSADCSKEKEIYKSDLEALKAASGNVVTVQN